MIFLQINWITFIIIALVVLLIAFLAFKFIQIRKMLNDPQQQVTGEYVKQITDANFNTVVNKGVTLVDFWAPWCAPCRMLTPVINEVAEAMKDKAQVGKINIEDNKRVAAHLGVRSIPTIMIFKDGELKKQITGVRPSHALIKEIEKQINN